MVISKRLFDLKASMHSKSCFLFFVPFAQPGVSLDNPIFLAQEVTEPVNHFVHDHNLWYQSYSMVTVKVMSSKVVTAAQVMVAI